MCSPLRKAAGTKVNGYRMGCTTKRSYIPFHSFHCLGDTKSLKEARDYFILLNTPNQPPLLHSITKGLLVPQQSPICESIRHSPLLPFWMRQNWNFSKTQSEKLIFSP
jgi:hypothetical protein